LFFYEYYTYCIEHPLYAVVVPIWTGIGWSSCVVYAGQLQSHLSWHAFCLGQFSCLSTVVVFCSECSLASHFSL